MFGPGVKVLGGNHRVSSVGKLMFEDDDKRFGEDSGITIEDDVWIGANSLILDGVTIRTGSVIGAGSIVTKSTKPYSINFGSPATFYKNRFRSRPSKTHRSSKKDNLMRICFFSSEGLHAIKSQQYSIQDVEILSKLGHDVVISSNFLNLDFKADLYFSWWASGSIIPMFLAKIRNKPIIVIAGGNEVLHTRDSVSNKKIGYLSYPFYKRMAVKLCIHFSDRLLVVSNFMKTELEKVHNIAPDLLYNSIDSRVFSPQESSEIILLQL